MTDTQTNRQTERQTPDIGPESLTDCVCLQGRTEEFKGGGRGGGEAHQTFPVVKTNVISNASIMIQS